MNSNACNNIRINQPRLPGQGEGMPLETRDFKARTWKEDVMTGSGDGTFFHDQYSHDVRGRWRCE